MPVKQPDPAVDLRSGDASKALGGVVVGGVSGSKSGSHVGVWDLETSKWLYRHDAEENVSRCRVVSNMGCYAWVAGVGTVIVAGPDHQQIATFKGSKIMADGSGLLGVGGPRTFVWDADKREQVWEYRGDAPKGEHPVVVAASADGKLVAVGGERRDAVVVYRLSDGEFEAELLHDDAAYVSEIAISAEGTHVAAVLCNVPATGAYLAVWEVSSGTALLSIPPDNVEAVRFSADATRFAYVSRQGVAEVIKFGEDEGKFFDVPAETWDICFLDSERVLVTAADGLRVFGG